MFVTLKTLVSGVNARAEEHVKDTFALELIDQKIRESEAQLKTAKGTLATLVQRQRSEQHLFEALTDRIETMTFRASEAIDAGRDDLAMQAAQAIATMENENKLRGETVDRLQAQIVRLKSSVEVSHRRLIDLRQGAITARAVRREQQMQGKLRSTIGKSSAADEAEALIERVVGSDDPFEQSQILSEIDGELSHDALGEKMAEQGFGPATKVTAQSVLDRLKQDKEN